MRQPIDQFCRTICFWMILLLLSLLLMPHTLWAQSNLTLTIAGTSEFVSSDAADGSAGNERPVLIGEIITFNLTYEISEGVSPAVNVAVAIPDGLQYVANSQNVSIVSDTAWSAPVTVSGGGSSGADVTFDFGTITNTDSDANLETITITFDALTLNIIGNREGDQLTTSAVLNAGGSVASTSEQRTVTVQEPTLTISKAIVGVPPEDALAQVVYDLTLTAGNTAYDVRLVDLLHPDLSLDSVVIQLNPGYVFITADNSVYGSGGGPVDVTINDLRPGDSVILRVTATVLPSVSPGETIANTANVTWSSLPGARGTGNATPGASGAANGERNGADGVGGALNDYAAASNAASFTISTNAPVKTIVATSESHTSDASADTAGDPRPVAIGEIIRYQLRAILPESTSISYELDDILAAGIEYIPGSARVSYLADTSPSFSGDFAGIQNQTTPTFAFPANRIAFDGVARVLSFDFGSIINNDGDANREFIIIEFNALVTNSAANSIGSVWSNDFDRVIDEGLPTEVITTAPEVFVIVQEPALTLSKTASPLSLNPGETLTYTLTITAGSNANQSAAFDVLLTDAIPTGLTYVSNSARHVAGVAPTTIVDSGAPTITFGYDTLQPGESSTVELRATVGFNTTPGASIGNQADVTWSSLPGANGTASNPTGSATPGSSGAANGERNGSGSGQNDYSAGNTASISTLRPDLRLEKSHRGNMAVGYNSDFTIVISNQGPGYATSAITFADSVPAELTLVAAVGAGWTCGVVGQDVSCTYPAPVAPGAALPGIIITVNPNTSIGSPFINTGVVTTASELDPSDNTSDDAVTVVAATPPVLANIANQIVAETETLSFTLSASGDAPLRYGLEDAPVGATVDDQSGQFSWTPTVLQGPAVYTATAVLTDANQLVVSQLFTLTVTSKPVEYAVTVDRAGLSEGDSGAQPVTFTINRAGLTGVASQVDYTLGGTATFGVDYSAPAASGTLIFAADALTQTVTISVTGDIAVEPNETVVLTLSNPSAAPGIDFALSIPSASVTIVNEDPPGERFKVLLPLVVNQAEARPDLIISDLRVSRNSVQVTIKNVGNAAVTEAFWIDLYFAPSRIPRYNDYWQSIASAGVVWGVTGANLPIRPGESLTLTYADAIVVDQGVVYSSSPPFPVGVPVYAQVDSVNAAGSVGGVEESNESNNVFGPVTSVTGGGTVPAARPRLIPVDAALPVR